MREEMKQEIYIIGCGMGTPETLTAEAREAMKDCKLFLGSPRLTEAFGLQGKSCLRNDEILKAIQASEETPIGVLVSGDPGFFSAAKTLIENLDGYDIRIFSGLSSLSYFCAKLKTNWDDAIFVSAHGRDIDDAVSAAVAHTKTFILSGGKSRASDICKKLTETGFGDLYAAVGENLSSEKERILRATLKKLAAGDFEDLSVLLIENPEADRGFAPGIPDEEFLRGDVPMTKFEVRSVSVAKLRVNRTDIVYDIGAGTGSVSIELARHADRGRVYALECREDAAALIEKNKEKFKAYNLALLRAKAPEGMDGLPAPDKVFIGGSGGNIELILKKILEKNPDAMIVINAVTLETLQSATEQMKQNGLSVDISQVGTAKVEALGGKHMLKAENPVFVICGKRSV